MAEFLHFYPQYRLDDLRAMPWADFVYLMGGMLDVLHPEATESDAERIARAVREQHEQQHSNAVDARKRGGW